jgi:hypothetical protein
MIDVHNKIASLTDSEVHDVLNRVVTGFAVRDRHHIPVNDTKVLTSILNQISDAADTPITPRVDRDLRDLAAIERELLNEMMHDEKLRPYVEGAIKADRSVLLDPITTALVMAGIVFVLGTKINIEITKKDGKAEYSVKLERTETSENIIAKFFALFSK